MPTSLPPCRPHLRLNKGNSEGTLKDFCLSFPQRMEFNGSYKHAVVWKYNNGSTCVAHRARNYISHEETNIIPIALISFLRRCLGEVDVSSAPLRTIIDYRLSSSRVVPPAVVYYYPRGTINIIIRTKGPLVVRQIK